MVIVQLSSTWHGLQVAGHLLQLRPLKPQAAQSGAGSGHQLEPESESCLATAAAAGYAKVLDISSSKVHMKLTPTQSTDKNG